ncbi:MAG: rhodanese-like domain-containing protein [Proteobacteria bacterium]|nr:rhodanese-like domain-containing protein [Pseudomonadota bacterium]MBU1686762.1 rhodanese-like domain-containing protein [Pseudomonadota bacterium]
MRSRKLLFSVPAIMLATLITTGSSGVSAYATDLADSSQKVATATQTAKAKGKILGVSNKARTITIEEKTGPANVKFTDATVGMEHAQKGEAAIITYRMDGKNKIAITVEPKLAELPPGVSELQPEELIPLIALGPKQGNYLLIDSRPAGPYAAGHIPGAVSIPVEKMKSEGKSLLPDDHKDKLLIFYCGGPT